MIKVNDIVKVNRIDWVTNRHVNKIKCGDVCVVYSVFPLPDSKYRYTLIVADSPISSTSVCMEGDLSVCNNYEDKEKWHANVAKAMSTDFGWSASAKKYVAMYEELLNK